MQRSPQQRPAVVDTFATRLQHCLNVGQLTVADLAIWFGRPHSTVRLWIKQQRAPRGPQGRFADERLRRLEWAIANKYQFPLDQNESQQLRPGTIERIRNELERAGVPARDPT